MAGIHVIGTENGNLKLNTTKIYHWHISKWLRDTPIEQGDIVLVQTNRGYRPVLVMNIFREEDTEKKQTHKRMIKLIEKAPENKYAVKK